MSARTDREDRELQALRDDAECLRTLADNIAQLAWMADASGAITWCNRRFREYTGMALHEANEWGLTRLQHPDHVDRVEAGIRRCIETGEPWEDTFPLLGADLQFRWFLSRAVPIRDEAGRVVRWLGTNTDVTEQRAAEEEIRNNEARLQAFVRSDVIGILFGDIFGGVQDCNQELARIIGRTREEVLAGKVRWTDITPVEDLTQDDKALAEAAANGHCRPYEKRYVRPDGTLVPVQVGYVLLEPERERSVAFILDLSERKAAEEALREADQRKGEFLAVLSHELRNPLAPIRNSVHILERAAPGGEQARRALSVIDRQVSHMARLVEDLLDVTRISRGKIRLQQEPLRLDEVVRGTGEDLRELFVRSGLELEVAVPDRPLRALADRTRIAQVVGNLLQNAAKFTPRGGHVRLSLEEDGEGGAIVEVRDDGAGIDPQLRKTLFEPFVQGDQTIDRSRGGLGLGLALVKGLTELHGGTVSVSSPGAGHGAVFTIRLPLESPALALDRAGAEWAERRRLRILVVGAAGEGGEGVKEVLEMCGHAVELAASVAEGIARARAARPDLVLCDADLADLDQPELTQALRTEPALRGAYRIALVGAAATDRLARAGAAGFQRSLLKPLELEALEAALGELPDGEGFASAQ
jgi:PAS domain S-box-containing protein